MEAERGADAGEQRGGQPRRISCHRRPCFGSPVPTHTTARPEDLDALATSACSPSLRARNGRHRAGDVRPGERSRSRAWSRQRLRGTPAVQVDRDPVRAARSQNAAIGSGP